MDIHVTCVCGRVYEKTEFQAQSRERGSFRCNCGAELDWWNSARVPFYRLISANIPERAPKG